MSLKMKEIRAMSKDDLSNKLSEIKMELIKGNAQIAAGTTPKSPGQLRGYKKTIAKINAALMAAESKKG